MSLKLLHVVRSLRRETGGLAEAVRNFSLAQRQRGDEPTIVSLDPADAGEESVVVLGESSEGYGFAPRYSPWLRQHAASFDLIAVHGLWQYQGFGTWRTLRGGVPPYLVFCHGMLDPWFKRTYPLKHVKKWLYWPWAEYRVLRDAAAVCFTTETEQRLARASFWLYRARERVLPLGIPEPPGEGARQREAFYAAYPVLQGRPFLLFLSRIHPKKGIELLLQGYAAGFAGASEAPRLVIAGPSTDETYRRRLQMDAARLGIGDRVVWLPMLSGDLKWGALRMCEALTLFSHQENFGVVVAEALACGRPVLISDQVNIWREIAGDGAGVAGADSVTGATETLVRWRASNAAERVAMGAAARACFKRRFAVATAVSAFDRLAGEIRSVANAPV